MYIYVATVVQVCVCVWGGGGVRHKDNVHSDWEMSNVLGNSTLHKTSSVHCQRSNYMTLMRPATPRECSN